VKANFSTAVAEASAAVGKTGSPVEVIGPGRNRMNLVAGLSPEMAASNLKSALLLGGQVSDDPIWINTAGDWLRSGLGVLSYLPGRYSLEHLYRYLFEAEYAALAAAEAEAVRDTLEGSAQLVLQSYLDYRNIFENFEPRFVAGVRATVSQLLGPFTHPDVVEAFCTEPAPGEGVEFKKILGGTVFLVDMPLSRWGFAGQTAYTFLKLRFFNVVQERLVNMRKNMRRVFLLGDEYQNIVCASKDGLSDLNFWDKSREACCVGIIGMQGVASIYAVLGNRDTADAIMQNFRQRIYFLTEDLHTLEQVSRVLGKVEVDRQTTSSGSSSGGGHSSRTSSSSSGKTDKTLVDAQVMRQLGPRDGIVVLNLAGRAKDDVAQFTPVFVDPPEAANEDEAKQVGAVTI
jgi:type IV secretory pathway TraG/TraD family ATPase VirD4